MYVYISLGHLLFLLPPYDIFANIDPGHLVICFNLLGKFEVSPPGHPRGLDPETPSVTRPLPRIRGPPTSCPSWEASLIRGKLPAWTKSKAKAARRWL